MVSSLDGLAEQVARELELLSYPPRSWLEPRRTASGVIWIAVAGVVLAGVVALNVAVLQRNLALDRLARERAQLRADNAALVSRLSSAAAAAKIETAARARGLVPADPASFTYVDISAPAK